MEDTIFDKNRVISFSDAIFSIAITLLVLEIAIPNYKTIVEYGTLKVLQSTIPSFIGLVVSFFVTAIYWIAHMRITKYISYIDKKLLWINISLLFFIVLLPFSTAFYVGGYELTGPFVFYCFNLSGIGLFNYMMVVYVVKKEEISIGLSKITAKREKARALNGLLVWIFSGIMAFILPDMSRYLFLLIFVINLFIDKYFKKILARTV